MNFVIPTKKEFSPFVQLLLLFSYAIAGAFIFTAIAVVIIAVMYGPSIILNLDVLLSGNPKYVDGLKLMQILSSIGMFILPPIILAYTEKRRPATFYGFANPKLMLLLIVFIIMIVSAPFLEWAAVWNQKLILPDFFKGIENWMREKEDEAMRMTIRLVTARSNWDFVVNLLMIALLPAIGEELMFRGGLQRVVDRMFGNQHAAIWISAFIFSAIHVQFYGFLPRLLLGAGFGYLYYLSGSLWYAMLAHFINNAYAVCAAFYMQNHNMPLDKADDPIGFPWYGYLISAILTIALFKFFKDTTQRERKLD